MPIVDAGWQRRLQDVLGVRLSELRSEHLHQLVLAGAAEAADLDFKSTLYADTPGDKRELCKDVAGMRNHRGGVVVLGIQDDDGVAVRAPQVDLSDAEARRMRQIVASGTAPYAEFEIEPIPGDADGRGFYVLVAPPSPTRPHAVTSGETLRYPMRDGTLTRWLEEVEVADLYRDRFRGQIDQLDRLERIGTEVISQVAPDGPWLVVSAVPNQLGSLPMSFECRRNTERWIREEHLSHDYVEGFFEPPAVPMVGVGVERYPIRSHFDAAARPSYSYTECHADGACVAARQLNSRDGDATVMGSAIVLAAAKCLHLVGAHAARAGASGDAAIHVRAVGTEMRLGYLRDGLVQHYPTHVVFQEVHSRHTFPLQPLSVVDRDLFLAVRLSVSSIFNGFGRAEVQHISEDGALRLPYFDDADFTRWARRRDLPITEERVEE